MAAYQSSAANLKCKIGHPTFQKNYEAGRGTLKKLNFGFWPKLVYVVTKVKPCNVCESINLMPVKK